MSKTLISYTDDNTKEHFIHILPEQIKYHDYWRKITASLNRGKMSVDNRMLAYENLEKCVKKFTYQLGKDEIIDCECGCKIRKCHIAKHRATKKHKKLMEAKETVAPVPLIVPSLIFKTDMICECGMIITKSNYKRHCEGSRHIKALLTKPAPTNAE